VWAIHIHYPYLYIMIEKKETHSVAFKSNHSFLSLSIFSIYIYVLCVCVCIITRRGKRRNSIGRMTRVTQQWNHSIIIQNSSKDGMPAASLLHHLISYSSFSTECPIYPWKLRIHTAVHHLLWNIYITLNERMNDRCAYLFRIYCDI
jgi:hypothetical protein